MQTDIRFYNQAIEVRAKDDGTSVVEGYASVFNRYSQNLGGFVEVVRPGAFKETITKGNDILGLFNHSRDFVLGRLASGTMRLAEDEKGLHYEIDLNPKDPDAQRVLAKIERGDVRGSSFSFTVMQNGETWSVTDDEFPLRELTSVRLYDVGPVTEPAYLDSTTEAKKRALSALAESRHMDVDAVMRMADEGALSALILGDTEEAEGRETHTPDFTLLRRHLDVVKSRIRI